MLIDMALSRIQSGMSGCGWGCGWGMGRVRVLVQMLKPFFLPPSLSPLLGAKEINLAASVEYLRDHRPHMVKTKVCAIRLICLQDCCNV